jgi:hypothetical protein
MMLHPPIPTAAQSKAEDWIYQRVLNLAIEDPDLVPTCRFLEHCHLLLRGDGCPTCDFVRGVIQDY